MSQTTSVAASSCHTLPATLEEEEEDEDGEADDPFVAAAALALDGEEKKGTTADVVPEADVDAGTGPNESSSAPKEAE
jgi:hypothetical protein